MMDQPFVIAELISRYLIGNITPDEEQELQAWREAQPGNDRLFHKLCNSEHFRAHYLKSLQFDSKEGWEVLDSKLRFLRRRKLFLSISRYAAVLLLPVAIGVFLYFYTPGKTATVAKQIKQQAIQILPGEKKATLTLDDGQIIDLKNIQETAMKEKDGTAILVDSTALNYELAKMPKNKKN